MNVAEMLGTPVNDPADFETERSTSCGPPTPPVALPQPRRTTTRLLGAMLAFASLVVGAGVGWYVASRPATAADHPVVVDTSSQAPTGVGDFAEMFTALYLSGTTPATDLAQMYPGPAPHRTGTWVNQTAAVRVESLGDGFWEVTVVVDSLESVDGTYKSAGVQYFDLTVSERDPYPVAVSAPSRIPPPATARLSDFPTFADSVPADQATAITHFFDGYLTHQEDVARYVTSTARIQRFAEPPYESISISSMGSDATGSVQVSVTATTPRGATHLLGYTLEMSFEAGVWEVSDLTSVVGSP